MQNSSVTGGTGRGGRHRSDLLSELAVGGSCDCGGSLPVGRFLAIPTAQQRIDGWTVLAERLKAVTV
ncbi:Hypothetical protein SMAX5B_004615 [Scophthalmus maximus]|uniref:Uncharacterized protein n=1 Tax=Scophthalmus maximus TaxID=52904 RepID=A0A2U9CKF0_SCOMX|nr:Hypothetical protein SMAX5B_004615 [Scophthalmus maximus]